MRMAIKIAAPPIAMPIMAPMGSPDFFLGLEAVGEFVSDNAPVGVGATVTVFVGIIDFITPVVRTPFGIVHVAV